MELKIKSYELFAFISLSFYRQSPLSGEAFIGKARSLSPFGGGRGSVQLTVNNEQLRIKN